MNYILNSLNTALFKDINILYATNIRADYCCKQVYRASRFLSTLLEQKFQLIFQLRELENLYEIPHKPDNNTVISPNMNELWTQKGVHNGSNNWLLQLLHEHMLYQSLHANFLFVITRWRHY